MGRSRPTINIDCKAESLRKEKDTLCLVASEGCNLLWALKPGKTINADFYRQQLIDPNHALLKKRPQYKKGNTSWFCSTTMLRHIRQTGSRDVESLNWEVLTHAAYSPDLHFWTTICFHRWVTRLKTSTSK